MSTFVIYRQDEDGQIYVTDIGESVGYFSGPGELKEAAKWKSEEKALEVIEWLNDPESLCGAPAKHFIQELSHDQ